jgi:hypothetical protein
MSEKTITAIRPKIASLSEKDLALLLKESFFKIGKELKLDEHETKLFLDEVYKKQGWMFVDTFSDVFSRYAACELPGAEELRPAASPLFIGKLMWYYSKKCTEKKSITNSVKGTFSKLTDEEKFNLFIKHVLTYRLLPGNPDWVIIYEYMVTNNKLKPAENWEAFGYMKKMKHAMEKVSEWTYENYEL